ncbi:MAG: SCO family protein [Aquificaceae bacterium]
MLRLFSLLILLTSLSFSNLLPNEKKTIGSYVPNILLQDHEGKSYRLSDFAQGKVLIINPVYTKCFSACPLMTEGLKKNMEKLKENVNVLSLSFDPSDHISDLKRFKQSHRLPENWIVARSDEVEKLLKAIDYKYRYDEKLKEFEHPNLYVILTPSGRVSRYIYGVSPKLRDLELSILEAKREEARLSPVEGFWLRCFRYNPDTGTYQIDWFFVFDVMGGLITFILIPLLVWGKSLRDYSKKILTFSK